MYSALSVAPSDLKTHYEFLANMNLCLGIGSMVIGFLIFIFLKKLFKINGTLEVDRYNS